MAAGAWCWCDGLAAHKYENCGRHCLAYVQHPLPMRPEAEQRPQAHREVDLPFRTTLALPAIIILATAVTASAATKKQRVPRSGPQPQAVAPRSAQPFNPYNPSLTGAGSPGYNQSLMTWR